MVKVIIVSVFAALLSVGAWFTYSELAWLDTRVGIIEDYLGLGE